jgi:hypothetical protein
LRKGSNLRNGIGTLGDADAAGATGTGGSTDRGLSGTVGGSRCTKQEAHTRRISSDVRLVGLSSPRLAKDARLSEVSLPDLLGIMFFLHWEIAFGSCFVRLDGGTVRPASNRAVELVLAIRQDIQN